MVDGVITINDKGTIQNFNKMAETMFGYSHQKVIDKNISVLMPDSDSKRHDGSCLDINLQKQKEDQRSGILGKYGKSITNKEMYKHILQKPFTFSQLLQREDKILKDCML